MRACEGCRRRKIKCDAATTNTWPCSACIRLKLHCVRPNGQFDGTEDEYESGRDEYANSQLEEAFRQAQVPLQAQMLNTAPKSAPTLYGAPTGYSETPNVYQQMQYSESRATQSQQSHHGLHYTTVPPPVSIIDQPYGSQNVFPTPPLQSGSRHESPPDAYSQDGYQQQDLADLLGSLKVNEAGTGRASYPPTQRIP